MQALRKINTEDKNASSFVSMVTFQNGRVQDLKIVSCSTICQSYEVPGGCTPCGTKCMMYCAGK